MIDNINVNGYHSAHSSGAVLHKRGRVTCPLVPSPASCHRCPAPELVIRLGSGSLKHGRDGDKLVISEHRISNLCT